MPETEAIFDEGRMAPQPMTPPGWRPICARPMPCAVPAGSSRWNSGGRKWPTIRSWAASI